MRILKFQNDDVTRKIQNARRNRRIATHEITKSKMSPNPRFLSTVSKIFGNGLYLKKGGMIAQVETDGQGVYLRPYRGKGLSSHGNGLYLKRGNNIYDGSGILTSIPIIGDILKTIF